MVIVFCVLQCLSPSEILATYQIHYENGINTNQFVQLCPAIIYQLDAQSCSPRPPPDHFHTDDEGDHLKYFHGDHDHHDHGHGNGTGVTFKPAWQFWEIPLKVWGYAVLSVTIISLVGLLGVAIVPIMQKVFYNHLLQFLVALAVGSLTGDALLHLIPHSLAIAEENHSHDEEGGGHSTEGVYRGLVILSGIYFFFITERLMTIIGDMRRKRKSNKKTKRKMQRKIFSDLDSSVGSRLSRHNELYHSCEEFVIMMNGSRVVHDMGEDGRIEKYQEFQMSRINEEDEANETTQMTEEVAPSQGHSHGGHGHSHHGGKVPGTVAAVAWMVIMGDGLHNFSDGLAIGAAFANSITGGLSTSVAVFCHELPHELGDFAVLLKAGMSVKQALVYNIISSVLCFVGMLIGVAVGNMSSASLWIFALAGGMFIYIALVDMLPEMNADHSENPLCLLLLQNIGMAVGITIMLLIALFEGDIKIDVEL